MTQNSLESSKKTYHTTDLTLSSFRRCRGFAIENVRQNNGRTLFIFHESPELRTARLEFANDAVVAVRSFRITRRDVKALLRVLIFFFAAALSVTPSSAHALPVLQHIVRERIEVDFILEPVEKQG